MRWSDSRRAIPGEFEGRTKVSNGIVVTYMYLWAPPFIAGTCTRISIIPTKGSHSLASNTCNNPAASPQGLVCGNAMRASAS